MRRVLFALRDHLLLLKLYEDMQTTTFVLGIYYQHNLEPI